MARKQETRPFGVYILTYPGDFHLSTVLVRSIRQVSPDAPIMIIPGERFDRADHPFDVPVMPVPEGFFWPEIGHLDRKFWAFQGPFETFLYLDADTICTRTLGPLIERTTRQRGDFIYVQPWIDDQEWRTVILDPAHQHHAGYVHHVSKTVGRGPLARFDPEHDCGARYPFNTGVFASRRLAIKETDFASLNRAERRFHHESPDLEEWTWQSSDLFFRDQGRLNYLVGKLSIPVYPLRPELICPAGASAIGVTFEDIGNEACDFHIVHWMGAKSPSPSLFCSRRLFGVYAYLWSRVGRGKGRWIEPGYERLPECVGYSLWRHYRLQLLEPISWREKLRWSWIDLKKACRLLLRYLRLLARRPRSARDFRRVRLVPPESTG